MRTRRSPMLYYVVNAALIGACLLQAALGYSDPQCQSPHGAQCSYPLPPGCEEHTYPDVPDRCCYMAWSRKCCQMDRTKHVYTGTCPGLPTHCSDCNGEVASLLYAECTTAGSGEGYCEWRLGQGRVEPTAPPGAGPGESPARPSARAGRLGSCARWRWEARASSWRERSSTCSSARPRRRSCAG